MSYLILMVFLFFHVDSEDEDEHEDWPRYKIYGIQKTHAKVISNLIGVWTPHDRNKIILLLFCRKTWLQFVLLQKNHPLVVTNMLIINIIEDTFQNRKCPNAPKFVILNAFVSLALLLTEEKACFSLLHADKEESRNYMSWSAICLKWKTNEQKNSLVIEGMLY